jgi:hypothetical protein
MIPDAGNAIRPLPMIKDGDFDSRLFIRQQRTSIFDS